MPWKLATEVRQLCDGVRGMRLYKKKASVKSTKGNTTGQENGGDIHGGSVPLETLMVLEGSLNGKRVRVVEDDGCNVNVVSREFLNNSSELFDAVSRPVERIHSEENTVVNASEVIFEKSFVS